MCIRDSIQALDEVVSGHDVPFIEKDREAIALQVRRELARPHGVGPGVGDKHGADSVHLTPPITDAASLHRNFGMPRMGEPFEPVLPVKELVIVSPLAP